MRYACLVTIFTCLAFGLTLSGKVFADLYVYDLGIGQLAQIPEGRADTLVVYSAKWCGPCKAYKPTLEAIKALGYKVVIVDVDNKAASPAEFRNFKYRYVPSSFFYNSSSKTVVRTKVGKLTQQDILSTLWKQ
jgi:thiol-disulfide isomerase/thioredoxin